MGESAVLVHSYSFAAPITRNESHEDNTIHALNESISFGKFMTENLEWGKWSSFSHKKYVEEAEKYSRPGSVAQKKAFFEAHYKRIAEAKKAATQEQPTVTPAQVLLHTLESQPLPLPLPPPPPRLSMQKLEAKEDDDDEEVERTSFQNCDVVVSDVVFVDANEKVGDEVKTEKKQEDDLSFGEKEKARRSVTKNRPVFRLSLEKTIPPRALDTATEISLSEKRSERLIETKEEKPVNRQRFSLLSCFMGSAKTQDQNQGSIKRNTEKKKPKNQFMCLCSKPKNVRES